MTNLPKKKLVNLSDEQTKIAPVSLVMWFGKEYAPWGSRPLAGAAAWKGCGI